MAEIATAADVITVSRLRLGSTAESASASDSRSSSLATAVSASETSTASDALSSRVVWSVAIAGIVAASDALARFGNQALAVAEHSSASDTLNVGIYDQTSDTGSVSDAASPRLTTNGLAAESSAAADQLFSQRVASAASQDIVASSDASDSIATLYATLSEVATAQDAYQDSTPVLEVSLDRPRFISGSPPISFTSSSQLVTFSMAA